MDTTHFDFDYWMRLAKANPILFEYERKKIIEEAIKKAPLHRQENLRRLQWKIDVKRSLCKNPFSAYLHIYIMMMDSVFREGGLQDSLNVLLGKKERLLPREAKILPFPKKQGPKIL